MKKTNAIRILEQSDIPYEVVPYDYDPQDLNVSKIALGNQLPVEQIYKTLVVKGNKTGTVIAVIPGNRHLDLKALAQVSGNKKMTLLPVKNLLETTGYVRGGCSPIGMKKNYPVFIDVHAQLCEKLFINGGKKGLLLCITAEHLLAVTDGRLCRISNDNI